MNYTTTQLLHLMTYELEQVEGNLQALSDSDYQKIMPTGQSLSNFKSAITNGELVLLTDSPITALFIKNSDEETKSMTPWLINPQVSTDFDATTIKAFERRANFSSGAGTFSAQPDSSANYQGYFDPPAPINYIPEPVRPDKVEPLPLNYEYNIEFACSYSTLRQCAGSSFKLTKTNEEGILSDWDQSIHQGHLRLTLLAAIDEPKQLAHTLIDVSTQFSVPDVTVCAKGAGIVNEAYIPAMPTVQVGQ